MEITVKIGDTTVVVSGAVESLDALFAGALAAVEAVLAEDGELTAEVSPHF